MPLANKFKNGLMFDLGGKYINKPHYISFENMREGSTIIEGLLTIP